MNINDCNIEQKEAFEVYKKGTNMFITGGAGVGKSWLTNIIIKDAKENNKNVLVTASTGIAALNIGGVTMHRAFKIPFGVLTYKKSTYEADDSIIASDIIIIDEISMCRIDVFDFMANKVLEANRVRKTQGKPTIQLILVGDFFQLPPVLKPREKTLLDKYYGFDIGLGFAYNSKLWNYFNFYNVILTQVMRQSDVVLSTYLNKLRTGNKDIFIEFNKYAANAKNDGIELCGTNREAEEINETKLNELPGQCIEYTAATTGEVYEQDSIAEFKLKLKVGARVIILMNDFGNNLNNGQFGTVTGLYSNAITVILDSSQKEKVIVPATWEVTDYRITVNEVTKEEELEQYKCGEITQFPLKLAYAMTIHKSQGQTFDKVNISPYCWECGQLYVAISRVRSTEGLHFNYVPEMRYAVTALSVIEFYNKVVDKVNKGQTIEVKETKEDIMNRQASNNSNLADLASVINMLK